MDIFTKKDLDLLLRRKGGPCISLYQPTHRGGAEADPLRCKNLLQTALGHLEKRGLRPADAKAILQPALQLLENPTFWANQSDGLAVFLAPEFFRSFRLPVPFAESARVADCFNIKPLLPYLASDGRFFLLALSQNQVRLLQGTAHSVHEVHVQGMPHNLAEAMRFHDRDEPLTFHTRPNAGKGRWAAIFHGHGVGIDDFKNDLLRYFQSIDHSLHDWLREEHAPLVLASVKYLWPIYHEANHYPHLFPEGIPGNPDELSMEELQAKGWALLQPHFQAERDKATSVFHRLAGTGRTTQELEEIVQATQHGEIEVLFLARDQEHWGLQESTTGRVQVHSQPEPGDEELSNLAALHTLRHGGTVQVLAAKDMPTKTPAAAIHWLPLPSVGKYQR